MLRDLAASDLLLGRYVVEQIRVPSLFDDDSRGNPLFRAVDVVPPFVRVAAKIDLVPTGTSLLDRPAGTGAIARAAALLARLEHSNIVRCLAFGMHESRATLITEWIQGPTLDVAPLNADERFEVALRLTEAVAYMHEQGILHRDIKPKNIVVGRRDGRPHPVLIDFDTAIVLGEDRPASGTIGWAAPEQLVDASCHLDRRSDIYSLGAVLAFLFTGRNPIDGPIEDAAARQILDPRPLVVPCADPALAALIASMLARERHARPASCEEVAQVLRDIRDGVAVATTHTARLRSRVWNPTLFVDLAPVDDITRELLTLHGRQGPRVAERVALLREFSHAEALRQAEIAVATGRMARAQELALAHAEAGEPRASLVMARVELFVRRVKRATHWAERAGSEGAMLLTRCHLLAGDIERARAAFAGVETRAAASDPPEMMALCLALQVPWPAAVALDQVGHDALRSHLVKAMRGDAHRRSPFEGQLTQDPSARLLLQIAQRPNGEAEALARSSAECWERGDLDGAARLVLGSAHALGPHDVLLIPLIRSLVAMDQIQLAIDFADRARDRLGPIAIAALASALMRLAGSAGGETRDRALEALAQMNAQHLERGEADWVDLCRRAAVSACTFDWLAIHRAWTRTRNGTAGVDHLIRHHAHLSLRDWRAARSEAIATFDSNNALGPDIAQGLACTYLAQGDGPSAALAIGLVRDDVSLYARWMFAATLGQSAATAWAEAAELNAPDDREVACVAAIVRGTSAPMVLLPGLWLALALRQLDPSRFIEQLPSHAFALLQREALWGDLTVATRMARRLRGDDIVAAWRVALTGRGRADGETVARILAITTRYREHCNG